ncbi:MAG: hypothetical protein WCE68_11580 [Anaerolineales bacterium]
MHSKTASTESYTSSLVDKNAHLEQGSLGAGIQPCNAAPFFLDLRLPKFQVGLIYAGDF